MYEVFIPIIILMGLIVFFHALATYNWKPKTSNKNQGSLPKNYYYRDALWDT